MRKIASTQRNVPFVFCPHPITIDRSSDWGPGNLQMAPYGAFLKMESPTVVSHLVQPNKGRTAPEGWVPGDEPGVFSKADIWVDDNNIIPAGVETQVMTLDGKMNYTFNEPSVRCYNDDDGQPNMDDGWVQKISTLKKNYEY